MHDLDKCYDIFIISSLFRFHFLSFSNIIVLLPVLLVLSHLTHIYIYIYIRVVNRLKYLIAINRMIDMS